MQVQEEQATGSMRHKACIVLLTIVALIGVWTTFLQVQAAFSPEVAYRRDVLQEYVLAAAALNGIDPYQPLPRLVQLFPIEVRGPVFPHASPHPPGLLPFILPLGALSYSGMQCVWLCLQVFSLLGASWLLWRRFSWSKAGAALFVLLVIGSKPGFTDLVQGQFALILALPLLLALAALERRQSVRAGVFLGIALSIKLYAGFALLYLLLKKRWSVVCSAGVVFLFSQVIAVILLGVAPMTHYYTEVLANVTDLYRLLLYNLSLFTLGPKLVSGANTAVGQEVIYPALVPLGSWVETFVGVLVALSAILLFCRIVRLRDEVFACVLLLMAQLLYSPISWLHGYTLAYVLLPFGFAKAPKLTLCFAVLLHFADILPQLESSILLVFFPYLELAPALLLFILLFRLSAIRNESCTAEA